MQLTSKRFYKKNNLHSFAVVLFINYRIKHFFHNKDFLLKRSKDCNNSPNITYIQIDVKIFTAFKSHKIFP